MKEITGSKMTRLLNWSYDKAVDGNAPGVKNVEQLAREYTEKYPDIESAIKHYVHWQEGKSGTTGVITGFGGFATMAATIPADLASVTYIQLKMIAVIATIRGYDPHDDEVRSLAFISFLGMTAVDFVKKTGIKAAESLGVKTIKNIPQVVLNKINTSVGSRFVTKFGEKGAINLGKGIPVLGAVVGGGIDYISTVHIANKAKKNFPDLNVSHLNIV